MDHQILFYQIDSKIYKRAPRLRFYVNQVLIDECEVYDQTQYHDANEEFAVSDNIKFFNIKPGTETLDLCWEIQNDDNNFTNGFMTKYTLVWFKWLGIIPLSIFKNFPDHFQKWKYRRSYFGDDIKTSTEEFRKQWNQVPQMFHNHIKHLQWSDSTGTGMYNSVHDEIGGGRVGKTGKFSIKYKKKYWCMVPVNFNGGRKRTATPKEIEVIYDKYKYNENLRNSNERTGHGGSHISR